MLIRKAKEDKGRGRDEKLTTQAAKMKKKDFHLKTTK